MHRAMMTQVTARNRQVAPGLHLIKGGVNTAVLERNGRALLIDPGELISAPRLRGSNGVRDHGWGGSFDKLDSRRAA